MILGALEFLVPYVCHCAPPPPNIVYTLASDSSDSCTMLKIQCIANNLKTLPTRNNKYLYTQVLSSNVKDTSVYISTHMFKANSITWYQFDAKYINILDFRPSR